MVSALISYGVPTGSPDATSDTQYLVSTLIYDLSQRLNPAACDIKKLALGVKARVRYYINNDSDTISCWGSASSPFFFIDNHHLQTRKRHPALDLPNKERHKVPIPIHIATGLRKQPSFLPDELLMKAVMRTLALIPAVIAFTFQRADVANRPDYVEEDS
ncbi:hypothetical protein PW30_002235, partial [Salmonella enterica subsp. enterica]|nr:hypothetical protein [Salmonella enterica subsp. enterica serovar Poona]